MDQQRPDLSRAFLRSRNGDPFKTHQQAIPAPTIVAKAAGHPFFYAVYLHVTAWVLRTMVHWLSGTGELFDKVIDVQTPALGRGNAKCSVCIPTTARDSPIPLILVTEGGGFVLGEPNDGEQNCRMLADKLGAVVLSLDYAKAPRYPFPHALLQLYQVLKWSLSPEALSVLGVKIDPSRVVTLGNSAGGNLAGSLALLLSFDEGACSYFRHNLPSSFCHVAQVLLYPGLALQEPYHVRYGRSPIEVQEKSLPIWAAEMMEASYTPPCVDRRSDIFIAPALADDALLMELAPRLPPAAVLLAGLDCLKHEGLEYAERLKRAGVLVRTKEYEGCVHGWTHYKPEREGYRKEDVRESWEMVMEFLKGRFAAD